MKGNVMMGEDELADILPRLRRYGIPFKVEADFHPALVTVAPWLAALLNVSESNAQTIELLDYLLAHVPASQLPTMRHRLQPAPPSSSAWGSECAGRGAARPMSSAADEHARLGALGLDATTSRPPWETELVLALMLDTGDWVGIAASTMERVLIWARAGSPQSERAAILLTLRALGKRNDLLLFLRSVGCIDGQVAW